MRQWPFVLLWSTGALLGAGCEAPVQAQNPLVVSSEQKAQQLVSTFFGHYVQNRFDDAVGLLCEQTDADRQRALRFMQTSQATGSRFRVDAFQVRSALAHWVGREPYYWVDVSFPRAEGGAFLHAYRVRVRDGCIEHFLGDPSLRRPPPAPSPTPPSPTPAPMALPDQGDPNGAPGTTSPPAKADDDGDVDHTHTPSTTLPKARHTL